MRVKIYKIVNDINDDIFIGSTVQNLSVCIAEHRRNSKKEDRKKNRLYQLANEHGWQSFRIILIDEVECDNVEHKKKEQQKYMDQLKPTLNKNNAYGSKCQHNRERRRCIPCGGAGSCEHKNDRRWCKDCKGSGICKHNRRRYECKDCREKSVEEEEEKKDD